MWVTQMSTTKFCIRSLDVMCLFRNNPQTYFYSLYFVLVYDIPDMKQE